MKKYSLLLAASAMVMVMTGCSDDNYGLEGEGHVNLRASVSTDVKVVSRADTGDALADSCNIWISKAEGGLVRRYKGTGNLPTDGITLLSGRYIAEAWTGDSVPASWDARFYKGMETFEVTPSGATNVDITCRVANTLVSVSYDEDVKYLLSDVTFTVGHTRGSLTFEGYETDGKKASFMMPNKSVTDLTYSLKGTKLDGTVYERTGTIANVKPTTEYAVSVKCTPDNSEIGGGYLTITIDPKEILIEDTIDISTAPEITGYEFDIDQPVVGSPGAIGRYSVWVRTVGRIESVSISNDDFAALLGIPSNTIDLVRASDDYLQIVKNHGVTVIPATYDSEGDKSKMKISFEPMLTNALTEGMHPIVIIAQDSYGRTTTATLTFKVAAVPVMAGGVEEGSVNYTSAVLTGTILQDDAEDVHFEYRDKEVGGDWISVPAVVASTPAPSRGAVSIAVRAELTGLTMGHTYEYRLVTRDYKLGDILEFTTPSVQLPNCGFEDWTTSSTPYLIYTGGEENMFWDSGNHGSATMRKNVTTPDNTVKHSGNYSAKLASQFVGVGALGKFAAGNIFIGKYLGTDGTDGILGFGRPFTQKPKALRAWVKYVPVAIDNVAQDAPAEYKRGDMDRGVIYVALLDNTRNSEYPDYPVVIKTKTKQLFDKNAANVVAYGELVVTKTPGSGMVQLTVPLEYNRNDVTPSFILCTIAASKGGDYFTGGSGSNLWVDDIELVY